MKAIKWIALFSATLILISVLLILAFLNLEPVAAPPPPLSDHPKAHWSGDVDGGAFFEITRAEPPRYFLEIRHESGKIWIQGWVSDQGRPLNSNDFWGYDGGDIVYLKNGKPLSIDPK
ncbi:hypothetical protein D3C78_697810 [compost metagenome]